MVRSTRLWKLTTLLLVSLLLAAPGVAADDDHGEYEGEDIGKAAAVSFGLSILIGFWRPVYKLLRKNAGRFTSNIGSFKVTLKTLDRLSLFLHKMFGKLATLVGFIHGILMDEASVLVWLAWTCMLILTASGTMMTIKRIPKSYRKKARLVHMRWVLVVVTVALLLLAHEGF